MGGRRPSTSASTGNGSSRQPHGGTQSNSQRARTFAEATALQPRKHAGPLGTSPPSGDVTARSTNSTQSTPPGLGFQPPALRPPTAGNVPPTPRTGRSSATPRGGGGRPITPATLPLVNLPHARQVFPGGGPISEPPQRGKHIATPRGGVSIPLLRLGGGDATAAMQTPRSDAAPKAQQRRPMRTPRGRNGRGSSGGGGPADRTGADWPGGDQISEGQAGRIGSKRGPQHSESDASRQEQEALRKRGSAWKQHQQGDQNHFPVQWQRQDNDVLQAKVAEAREASGGELPDALRAAVADNERLNKQLHVLHGNATQLRQAIADARSLQMHLQQEAADARLLAVGLQAQLRDAEAHTGEAEADRGAVRGAGLQLVRDTVAMFQLTATEVFGSATLAFAQQQEAGTEQPPADMLDHKSFSLMQNAQALLAPGCHQAQVSGTSSLQQTNMSPKAQGGGAHSNQHRPALRALPGKSPRIAADSPANASSPARQPPQQAVSVPLSSSVEHLALPSSRLAQRIASMHQKFAAATNLMDADDDSSDSTIAM